MATTPLAPFNPLTPFEAGNQNQTTSWQECIAFYQELAARYPQVLHFWQIGHTDGGHPLHAGIVSADGVFALDAIKAAQRPVFFNNNGIHPGEPEGVDVCMALVRDFCLQPERLAQLGETVFLFIPVYNVDGCLNRANTSRVSQEGPENFGFRGNSLHLDLNRDFLKCDSLAAQCFNRFFAMWQPDVMVDTHTSNGADYPYTMTLIPTQPDKLGGALGDFLRSAMLPAIYTEMEQRGWPTCPYVNPLKDTPEDGIVDFLETARFSTGYAALHHCIGFMPETHMLKSFAARYAAMRALVETVLNFTLQHAHQIQALRKQAKTTARSTWPIYWEMRQQPSRLRFQGYAAQYRASAIGHYQRLYYDRQQPWDREIDHYDRFDVLHSVPAASAYIIPQQWRAVIERLQWNGVQMRQIESSAQMQVQTWRIAHLQSRPTPYEGHLFHEQVTLTRQTEEVRVQAGDWYLPLNQEQARYAVESLEPLAHDSFFRWGFFNSILEKKESYSDYVFEDEAERLLQQEPELAQQFAAWKEANPELLNSQTAVLDFIYQHCARYREPEWRRYPIWTIWTV